MTHIRATDRLLHRLVPTSQAHAADYFGDAQAELRAAVDGNVMTPLVNSALIRLEGEDVVTFLQGQLTADVRLINGSHSSLAAWLNPKGRVQTLMRLLHHDGALHMMLPSAFAEPTLKRLRMFVLRAKVTLTPVDDELATLGVAGIDVASALRAYGALVPEETDQSTTYEGCTFVTLRGARPRLLVFGTNAALEPLVEALESCASPVGTAAWQLLDIEAGIPDVEPGAEDAYLPQMLNLQALGAVNFDKGCYVGQEIVARTQYLGRLKRRLYQASVQPGTRLATGMPIYAAGTEHSAGTVLNTAKRPDGSEVCLAVIQIDAADLPLKAGAPDGAALEFADLPYPLESP